MSLTFTKEVGKYVIGGLTGTGITLVSLLAWTGAEDLQAIKDSVQSYVTSSEQQASALLSEYNVLVDNANAEIETYQQALTKANSNIDQLIEKYNTDQATLNATIQDLQQQLEASQGEVASLVTQAEANEIIAKANEEIGKANEDVAQAKLDVNDIISNSEMSSIASGEKSVLNTEGDKTVNGIVDVVGILIESVEDLGNQSFMISALNVSGQVYKFTFNDGTTIKATSRYIYEKNNWKYHSDSTDTTYLPLIQEYFAQ